MRKYYWCPDMTLDASNASPGVVGEQTSWFVISVSWRRSLSLILIIVIIDILVILYVKVFIKMGNTPFEHFSCRWNLCLRSWILIWSLFGFIYDLLGKWLKLRFGCIYYGMCFEIWEILRFWNIRFWELSILICALFGFYLRFIK